jgi:hypothetical protein
MATIFIGVPFVYIMSAVSRGSRACFSSGSWAIMHSVVNASLSFATTTQELMMVGAVGTLQDNGPRLGPEGNTHGLRENIDARLELGVRVRAEDDLFCSHVKSS